MRCLLATRNAGKEREFAALFAGLPIELDTLRSHPDWPEVVEDGLTFRDNAWKKAREAAARSGAAAIADDSGLVVDALDGAPGVFSARYAGEPCDDARNNAKLLAELAPYPDPAARRARFVCALAFVGEDGTERMFEASVEGRVGYEERGTGGFGYDSVFVPEAYPERHMAELSDAEKHAISHRGQASRALAAWLRERLGGEHA